MKGIIMAYSFLCFIMTVLFINVGVLKYNHVRFQAEFAIHQASENTIRLHDTEEMVETHAQKIVADNLPVEHVSNLTGFHQYPNYLGVRVDVLGVRPGIRLERIMVEEYQDGV